MTTGITREPISLHQGKSVLFLSGKLPAWIGRRRFAFPMVPKAFFLSYAGVSGSNVVSSQPGTAEQRQLAKPCLRPYSRTEENNDETQEVL